MLTIRLQRVGRKNQPIFRIVLAEKHRSATKKTVEDLGLYNPRNKDFSVKEERLKHWLGQHVELSPTVHNLLVTRKLVEGKKVQAWKPKRSPAGEAGKPAEASAKAENPAAAPAPAVAEAKTEEAKPAETPAAA